MEKLMYVVWKKDGQSIEKFHTVFCQDVAGQLQKHKAHQVRLAIADNAVNAAHKLRILSASLMSGGGAPDAVISIWLDSAAHRQTIEPVLSAACSRICGYLVTESEPLPNQKHPVQAGQRTYGMNQVVLLQRPQRLNYAEWTHLWLDKHTPIAIRTQSTFGYRQNLVVRTLTQNTLHIDAIVEENFPPEAMRSAHAFYNAIGDDELLKKNQSDMFASVQQFIDLDKLDCLPMSEYNF